MINTYKCVVQLICKILFIIILINPTKILPIYIYIFPQLNLIKKKKKKKKFNKIPSDVAL